MLSNPRELISKAIIDALHEHGWALVHNDQSVADKIAYHSGVPIDQVYAVLNAIRDIWRWSW